MNNNISRAILSAFQLHDGQVRKGNTIIPYIVHPIEVAVLVSKYSNDDKHVIAGLLHDTVEDCGYSLELLQSEYGSTVRTLVEALTEDKSIEDWWERKLENLRRLRENKDAYFIKSIDALSNMRGILELLESEGYAVWDRFNAVRDAKLTYFRMILEETKEFLPRELLKDYAELLKDLEHFRVADELRPVRMLAGATAK